MTLKGQKNHYNVKFLNSYGHSASLKNKQNIVQNHESSMVKSISCKDAGKTCGWSATAKSEDELLQITLEHVKEHHKELVINSELSKNIRALMKDTK
jgi:predicted small metal-binding protein